MDIYKKARPTKRAKAHMAIEGRMPYKENAIPASFCMKNIEARTAEYNSKAAAANHKRVNSQYSMSGNTGTRNLESLSPMTVRIPFPRYTMEMIKAKAPYIIMTVELWTW